MKITLFELKKLFYWGAGAEPYLPLKLKTNNVAVNASYVFFDR